MLLSGVAFFGGMFTGTNNVQALPVEPTTPNRININDITSHGGVMDIQGAGNSFISWRDFSVSAG